tara:strand:- start:402 stop:866 length:465 start_codon:yes stop_codon:yes gene_type:complete
MEYEDKISQDINCIEFMLLDKYGVSVDFDENGENEYWFDPDDREDMGLITIDSSMELLEQLFVLLHEAGHVVLRSNKEDFLKRFPNLDRNTLSGRVEILREEVMAWDEAANLIKKYGIDRSDHFDLNAWRQNYRSALAMYASWVEKGDCHVNPS